MVVALCEVIREGGSKSVHSSKFHSTLLSTFFVMLEVLLHLRILNWHLMDAIQMAAKAGSTRTNAQDDNDRGSEEVGMSDIATFLSKAVEPPKASAIFSAIEVLQQLGAIDQLENLTPLGRTLTKLTVHPRFGKMLVYGVLLGCLDPLLTIAAGACFRDPFVSPVARREEADRVRESFGVGVAYGSDQLALVNAFEQWVLANSVQQGYIFCDKSFLAPMTMRLIAGLMNGTLSLENTM